MRCPPKTIVNTLEIEKPSRRRRSHTEELKQAMIAACCEAGASVAGITLDNEINANQLRRWIYASFKNVAPATQFLSER